MAIYFLSFVKIFPDWSKNHMKHRSRNDLIPDVSFRARVLFSLEQLRRRIWRTSTPRCQRRRFYVVIAEAEICQLDVHLRVEQKVLGLQVSVDDAVRVAVVDGRQDLGEDVAGFQLCHFAVIHLKFVFVFKLNFVQF